jgi:hypothetical protein
MKHSYHKKELKNVSKDAIREMKIEEEREQNIINRKMKYQQKKEKEDKRVELYDSTWPALPGSTAPELSREQKAAIMQASGKAHYEKIQKEKEEKKKAYEERKAIRIATYYRKEAQHVAKMEEILGPKWIWEVNYTQYDCEKAKNDRIEDLDAREEAAFIQERIDQEIEKIYQEKCKEKERIHEETIRSFKEKKDEAGLREYLYEYEDDEYMDDSNYFWESAQSVQPYIDAYKSHEERIKDFEDWKKTPESQIWNWVEMKKLINC